MKAISSNTVTRTDVQLSASAGRAWGWHSLIDSVHHGKKSFFSSRYNNFSQFYLGDALLECEGIERGERKDSMNRFDRTYLWYLQRMNDHDLATDLKPSLFACGHR